jgi:hypothetical protein
MVSWETVVEEASMHPLVLIPIQSGQGLPGCVYNARLVFARTFSLWKHHNLIPLGQRGFSEVFTLSVD